MIMTEIVCIQYSRHQMFPILSTQSVKMHTSLESVSKSKATISFQVNMKIRNRGIGRKTKFDLGNEEQESRRLSC